MSISKKGTSNDLRDVSGQDVRGALLSSIVLKMADLFTHFSTLNTTSPRLTLYILVIMHSKELSIMFYYFEIKSSCLA